MILNIYPLSWSLYPVILSLLFVLYTGKNWFPYLSYRVKLQFMVVDLLDLLLELMRVFLCSLYCLFFSFKFCGVILIPQSSRLGRACNVVTPSVLEISQI